MARRRSVRAFAQELGVGVRTVSNWEARGAAYRPRPDTQAILDTTLARCDPQTVLRFETLLTESAGRPGLPLPLRSSLRLWEYETWVDDLERAVAALGRQDFMFASDLLDRWRSRWPAKELDDRGLYLFARTTVLLGDLQRDQGSVLGPLSAARSYLEARSVFEQLAVPRRVAQLDLSLAVVSEMSGKLTDAATRYRQLATDVRLSSRDRARAQLWVGTALDKTGDHATAATFMTAAIREFDALGEPEDWSVGHQKLALAHRGAGNLAQACQLIEVARRTSTTASPMQQVRLATAEGHILLSDPETAGEGIAVLGRAADTAAHYGMSHQLRSIEGIRRGFEQPARALQRA
ncbi:hypothetical protein ACIA8O_36935 [Kitasatospora sp. NPDC051853]|uniref:hypothetical protein n=1 Tax=Kitasatospora sp. NPDC051853 TaxID=3364058 RepID=UPI00378994E6